MGKIENDMVRKKKNEHFIKAFEYVAQCKNMNQTQLAIAIGSKVSYISVYRNGTRPVPEETIDALIRISVTIEDGDGQIYKPYLLGLSDYMLLRNVPDEEIADTEMRKNNPDYDLLKARRESKEKDIEKHFSSTPSEIDPSSAINAALAAQASEIVTLKQTIDDMKEQHQRELYNMKETHKREIDEKDAHISDLKKLAEERLHRIAELRRIIDANNMNIFPFPVGSAEPDKKDSVRV